MIHWHGTAKWLKTTETPLKFIVISLFSNIWTLKFVVCVKLEWQFLSFEIKFGFFMTPAFFYVLIISFSHCISVWSENLQYANSVFWRKHPYWPSTIMCSLSQAVCLQWLYVVLYDFMPFKFECLLFFLNCANKFVCDSSKFFVWFHQNSLTFEWKMIVCAFVLIYNLSQKWETSTYMSNDSKRWFSLVMCAIYRRIVDITIYS